MSHHETATDEYSAHTHRYINHVVDDPWRYVCPDCTSPHIVVRRKLGSPKEYLETEDSDVGTIRWDGTGTAQIHDFRCDVCGATFDDPYDKKDGTRRELHTEYDVIGGYNE